MGYSTDFSGHLTVGPLLSPGAVEDFNEFCSIRHEGSSPGDPCYSIWCDWEVSADGSRIRWNGSEKSYNMEDWLPFLIAEFCHGSEVNGTIDASGEEPGDLWRIVVTHNEVERRNGTVVY